MGFAFNLYIGGLDIVTTSFGNLFRHLADHPEHQTRLRAETALIPDAIEELMRAHSPAETYRTCIKETQIRGVTPKPSDRVVMPLADRDPKEFERPNEIVLERGGNHLAFGHGIHRRIGIHPARMEWQSKIEGPGPLESSMLDSFESAIPNRRLSRQLQVTAEDAGLVVRLLKDQQL